MTHTTTTTPESATSRLVTVFRNAKAPRPFENISLREVLERTRDGKYQEHVDEVLAAAPEEQQAVKAHVLPAFTPSGVFTYRNGDGLAEHSGVVVLDIDDKTDPDGYKERFANDPHVLAAIRSPRGGVKAFIRILGVDRETGEVRLPENDREHKEAMAAVFEHFGHEDPDPSGKDAARLCFFSVDPDPYVNWEAEPLEFELGGYAPTPSTPGIQGSGTKPAGRAGFDAVIPKGTQYNSLLQMTGAIRRLGFGEPILLTVAEAVFNKHLEDPNDWDNVAKMVHEIAEKDVEPHTSAEEMARRAVWALQKGGHLDEPNDATASINELPWRPFPTEALPSSVQSYVRALAAATNTDEAFVAVPALVMLAAAVGNSYRIRIKESWEEPSTLWALIVADSGTGKSPTMYAALKPVFALENEAKERYETARKAYDDLDPKQKEVASEPSWRRFRVSDTTIESLMAVHEANQRGLLLYRDEAAAWFGSFNKYNSGESDLQSWLETYNGRSLVIDRKTSKKPVLHLDRPNVCVTGTIQPRVLRDRLSETHLSSGFAARLLLVEPPVRPKRWSEADLTPGEDIAYKVLIHRMYALPYRGIENACRLELTPGAKESYVAFWEENGRVQQSLPSGPLQAALSKHEALAARCALALHLADHVDAQVARPSAGTPGPVSVGAMRRGIVLARWFRYETARLYQAYGIEEQAVDRDVRLAAKLPETFTWHDVGDLWEVSRSGAFKTVHRLIDKGLAENDGHGSYKKLSLANEGGHVDFGDFESDDGTNHDRGGDKGPQKPSGVSASTPAHEVHRSTDQSDGVRSEKESEQPTEVRVREVLSFKRTPSRFEVVEGDEGPILKPTGGLDVTYGSQTFTLDELFDDQPSEPSDSPDELGVEDGGDTPDEEDNPGRGDGRA